MRKFAYRRIKQFFQLGKERSKVLLLAWRFVIVNSIMALKLGKLRNPSESLRSSERYQVHRHNKRCHGTFEGTSLDYSLATFSSLPFSSLLMAPSISRRKRRENLLRSKGRNELSNNAYCEVPFTSSWSCFRYRVRNRVQNKIRKRIVPRVSLK